MATHADLVKATAFTLRVSPATVGVFARYLREGGLIRTGGRGRSATKMTSEDASSLLIALMAVETGSPREAVAATIAHQELEFDLVPDDLRISGPILPQHRVFGLSAIGINFEDVKKDFADAENDLARLARDEGGEVVEDLREEYDGLQKYLDYTAAEFRLSLDKYISTFLDSLASGTLIKNLYKHRVSLTDNQIIVPEFMLSIDEAGQSARLSIVGIEGNRSASDFVLRSLRTSITDQQWEDYALSNSDANRFFCSQVLDELAEGITGVRRTKTIRMLDLLLIAQAIYGTETVNENIKQACGSDLLSLPLVFQKFCATNQEAWL